LLVVKSVKIKLTQFNGKTKLNSLVVAKSMLNSGLSKEEIYPTNAEFSQIIKKSKFKLAPSGPSKKK